MFTVKKGQLSHIRITPSENGGASVETHIKKMTGPDAGREWNTEKHDTVHTSHEEVAAHVKKCLQGHAGCAEKTSGKKPSTPAHHKAGSSIVRKAVEMCKK